MAGNAVSYMVSRVRQARANGRDMLVPPEEAGFHTTMLDPMQLLRHYGLRVTPQRLLLIEIIRDQPAHFTAEEVYRQVRGTFPGVSVVSIYRSLETFRKLGIVTRTAIGDSSAVYEWALGDRHHHLICAICGHVDHLIDAELNPLRELLHARYGFEAAIDHYAIFGRCAACSARMARKELSS